MADFSLTTVFVVPVGNTLPTTGSMDVDALTPGKFGVYLNTYAAATTGNIAAAPYIYLSQGRTNTFMESSKTSDKIAASRVKQWYKVTGSATAANEIWSVGNFNVKCGEILTLTFRLHSSYIDTAFFNGLTRSVTVQAPCCDCGADPCDTVDVPALIDSIIAKLTQQSYPAISPAGENVTLSKFLSFQRIGDDQSATLLVSGKPLNKYGNPCDIAAYPYEYDRMWFRIFAYKGPETSSDFIVYDECNVAATAVVTQRSTYPRGTAEEVRQMEIDYYSYQSIQKDLFRMAGYNQLFDDWTTSGTVYDIYTIKFLEYDQEYTWGDYIHEDETVIVPIPSGAQSTAFQTLLTAYLGAPVDKSGPVVSTTTTTSTTSTTTSSTTTLIP